MIKITKNDNVHFYSHLNNKIKMGLIIGVIYVLLEYVVHNTSMTNLNISSIPLKA